MIEQSNWELPQLEQNYFQVIMALKIHLIISSKPMLLNLSVGHSLNAPWLIGLEHSPGHSY